MLGLKSDSRNHLRLRRKAARERKRCVLRQLVAELLESRLPLTTVTSVSPDPNFHRALPSANVVAHFDRDIVGTLASPRTFAVHSMQRGQLAGSAATVNTSGSTVTLDPTTDFFAGELVQATVTRGIQDSSANPPDPLVWHFRTAVSSGNGVFSNGKSLANPDSRDAALGDLDGDGDLDAFVANGADNGNRVWLNSGGDFSDSGQSLGDNNSKAVALGDLDGDGDLDAFVVNGTRGSRTWLNDGGVFTDTGQVLGEQGIDTDDVSLGDVDGDGDLDALVTTPSSDHLNRLWINDKGVFSNGNVDEEFRSFFKVELGDLDSDGDLDAFLTGFSLSSQRVWLNEGSPYGGGGFVDSGQRLGITGGIALALGDLDGDSDLDAVVITGGRGPASETAGHVWLNNGAAVFSDSGQRLVGINAYGISLGDLDSDGDLDAYVVSSQGQSNRVWLNEAGVFTDSGQRLSTDENSNVVLGDLDGDGDLDVFETIFRRGGRVRLNQLEDAELPTVALKVDNTTIAEAAGTATLTGTLSAASSKDVTIDLELTGSASDGVDYIVSSTRMVIPAGTLSGTATITALQDTLEESDESVIVDIARVTNGRASASQQITTTIIDDDGAGPTVTLSVNNVKITEDGGVATFTATLLQLSTEAVSVDLDFSGTATITADYSLSSTRIVIPAARRSGSATVTAVKDALNEPDETVIVEIANVVNGTELDTQRQTTTITNIHHPASGTPGKHPAANSHNVPVSSNVAVTFDQSINRETATASSLAVHSMQRGQLVDSAATVGVEGSSATLDPTVDFFPGEFVQVTATSGIHTTTGEPVDASVWQFQSAVHGGSGLFLDSGQSLGSHYSFDISLGDLDGDGDLDAFVANGASHPQGNRVWFNDGGRFTSQQGPSSHLSWAISLGDLDADGDLDAFVANRNQDHRVWVNYGSGDFIEGGTNSGGESTGVALGDLDGDGDLDAFVTNDERQPNRVFRNDGGIFTDTGQLLGDHFSRAVSLGDLDGDGDLDAFVVNVLGADRVWLNEGGRFSNSGQNLGDQNGLDVSLGDVDGDGDLDVFIATSRGNRLWLNNGAGVLQDSGQSLGDYASFAAALGDLDGDGDLDAIVANQNQGNRVWLNQSPISVSLSVDNPIIGETSGVATITATLSASSAKPVTVDLSLSGTATLSDDYMISGTQIVVPAGATGGSITVTAVQDQLNETDETVVVDVASVVGATEVGTQQQTITIVDDDELPSFAVSGLEPTASGFRVEFNNQPDFSNLNLYDTQNAGLGPADAMLTGATSGVVAGSLVMDGSLVTFIKSGGPLAADTYTVTLRSAANGFKGSDGMLLDGNGDGTAGDDYVSNFTVAAPPPGARTIGIPDFVRGPGQVVNLPADTTTGIPITISEGTGVRAAELRIRYNPALLQIQGATAPAGGSVTVNTNTPGLAILVFFSSAALPAGSVALINLQASVPSADADEIYGTHQVLDIHGVTIDDGSDNEFPVVADDSFHLTSYFADVSGNGRINASDASQVARFAAFLDSGFGGSPNADPVVVGDFSGNGRINAADASLSARFAARIPVPEIPPIPGGFVVAGQTEEDLGPGLPDVAALPSWTIGAVPGRFADISPRTATMALATASDILVPAIDRVMARLGDPGLRDDDEEFYAALEEAIEQLLSAVVLAG